MPKNEFIWLGNTGCFLPFLIFFNFLFGRFILGSTKIWLISEALLIFLFILKLNIMARKINRQFNGGYSGEEEGIIDIQGHVIDEEKKIK